MICDKWPSVYLQSYLCINMLYIRLLWTVLLKNPSVNVLKHNNTLGVLEVQFPVPIHEPKITGIVYALWCHSACRRYSNYIFILYSTPGFKSLVNDNCKMRWESFKFCDLVRLILENLGYIHYIPDCRTSHFVTFYSNINWVIIGFEISLLPIPCKADI